MLLFLLSLTGIPPTAGFAAKFVVILSVVRAGHVWLAVLAVACSVVTAFVYLRVAVLMYMQEPQSPAPPRFPVAVSGGAGGDGAGHGDRGRLSRPCHALGGGALRTEIMARGNAAWRIIASEARRP